MVLIVFSILLVSNYFVFKHFLFGCTFDRTSKLLAQALFQFRLRLLDEELSQVLETLRACLKAGLPLSKAIEHSILNLRTGSKGILFKYLNGLSHSIRAGVSLSEALEEFRAKLPKTFHFRTVRFLASSLKLGVDSGGNIAHLIEVIQDKLRTNILLRRKMKAITSQMRMQASVVSLSPLVLGVLLVLFDWQRMAFFFETFSGNILLGTMIASNLVGAWMLLRMGSLELA